MHYAPTLIVMPYSHGNNGMFFDSYFNGSNWVSSSAGSNAGIYKIGNGLSFFYNSGITPGSALSWNTAGYISLTTGNLEWQKPLNITDTTASTNTVDGAFTCSGGASVSGTVNIGTNLSVGCFPPKFCSGSRIIALADASPAPSSNPDGGGLLYSEGGALKWRSSSGTITTLASA